MVSRNVLSLCALVLLGVTLAVQAMPEPKVDETNEAMAMDTFSKIDDILKLIKKHLKHAKSCLKEAKKRCKNALEEDIIEGLRCVIKHVTSNEGKCKHPGIPNNSTSTAAPTPRPTTLPPPSSSSPSPSTTTAATSPVPTETVAPTTPVPTTVAPSSNVF